MVPSAIGTIVLLNCVLSRPVGSHVSHEASEELQDVSTQRQISATEVKRSVRSEFIGAFWRF